jgi:3D (Asp-Asp-Asp) domain-containing protein
MTRSLLATTLFVGVTLFMSACSPTGGEESVAQAEGAYTESFTAEATAYYPDSSALEGGFVDRKGKRLQTLQQFLDGEADYVSVAMDTKAFSYGQRLRIHELEEKYEREIVFRVVDTGGAFRGKGRSRIDVCVQNEAASLDPSVNSTLTIDVVEDE